MESDSQEVVSSERTAAEIDAELGRHVAAANDALISMGALECKWWCYTVSHCTLELVIGDAIGRGGNLVVVLCGCSEIAGPVHWKTQKLQVVRERSKDDSGGSRYVLSDDAVKFKAVGGMVNVRRDYDLLKYGSAAFPNKGSFLKEGE